MKWTGYVDELAEILKLLDAKDLSGKAVACDDALDGLCRTTLDIKRDKRTIFFVGNGASAAMASHAAVDLAKNIRMRTEVFTDLALITALGNDIGYESVYSEPLKRRLVAGDMLVAISSSGMSPNILSAVEVARGQGGLVTTLSAMNQANALRRLGDLNFYVPARTYGFAESAHAAILHCWIDRIQVCMDFESERLSPQQDS